MMFNKISNDTCSYMRTTEAVGCSVTSYVILINMPTNIHRHRSSSTNREFVQERRYRRHGGTFAPPRREMLVFFVGDGHMAMFQINRESDAFENPMLRNLCKESHCIALLWMSHWVTACIITIGLPVPVFSWRVYILLQYFVVANF